MKKVFTVLVAAAFVSFSACKNAPKNVECDVVAEETTIVEDGDEELFEECVEEAEK